MLIPCSLLHEEKTKSNPACLDTLQTSKKIGWFLQNNKENGDIFSETFLKNEEKKK
jgi:hypothetical protein